MSQTQIIKSSKENNKTGEYRAGLQHTLLIPEGMKLDFSIDGQVKIDMKDYVTTMIEIFTKDVLIKGKIASPWTDSLFKVDQKSKLLDKSKSEQFQTTTGQALFLCKRDRPDISPAVAFFTIRVKASAEKDWNKLVRVMQYLH